tara:strand:- start:270 stop:1415 length:1146 start_codon:yes stop_codon:yes gene_type:complete
MNKKIVKEVQKSFISHFKTKPLVIFSPGRINLIGEHTDYNEGFVFPAAINKGIALAIQKSNSKKSSVYALNKEEIHEFSLDIIQPLENGGWRNYILGVVAEIQKTGIELENFNIVFTGDIPSGAGMSSSAAMENSVVFGLNELFGLGISKQQMILISQKAEHNYAGVKCGIMDQYASMFGKKKSGLLLDCRTVASVTYKIDFKDYKLLLINTNVKHDLSESAYNDRRAVCEKVSRLLNINALRDATKGALEKVKNNISEDDYQKCLYIIEENERVQLFSKAIQEENTAALGAYLYESHKGLSTQYKVSCKELDFLVNSTKENPNILGARMMGGGFGGCTINLILKSQAKKFKKEISKSYLKEFNKECSIYSIKLSKGTRKV